MPRAKEKIILFIIGCQRSGTIMMQKVFRNDLQAKVYGEFSKLSRWDPNKIRLNPLDQVKREIRKNNPPLIVLKPLVETQNIHDLLDFFSESKALWMYRHYKDVAASNLINFGQKNGIEDLKPIVSGDPFNWRSEGASEKVREVISKHYAEDMNEHDAAALFWYARNSLFFDLNLEDHPRVLMCRYENMVVSPKETMDEIYDFIDCLFPGEKIVTEVQAGSVGKGKNVRLRPEIETLCQEMFDKLNEVFLSRKRNS